VSVKLVVCQKPEMINDFSPFHSYQLQYPTKVVGG
jgi:hypothetical protein